MVVIPEKKLIFIHVPRTGGMSLTNILCRTFKKAFRVPGTKHWKLSEVSTEFAGWDSFGFYRNPYDRMVSFYYFMKTHYPLLTYTNSFEQFLMEFRQAGSPLQGKHSATPQVDYFTDHEGLITSKTTPIQYNSLGNELILSSIFKPDEVDKLIKATQETDREHVSRRIHTSWQEYYVASWMKDVVYSHFVADFHLFDFNQRFEIEEF